MNASGDKCRTVAGNRKVCAWTIPLLGRALFCLTMAGCHASVSTVSVAPTDSFEVRLLRGVRWTSDTLRFDPTLPGYRLTGGIGTITLRLKPGGHAEKLVLAIRTSPGMPPNLEGFTLSWGDTTLSTSPFGGSGLTELILKNQEDRWRTISRAETRNYFSFLKSDTVVAVSFLPPALRLLRRECTVSWVDWYRK